MRCSVVGEGVERADFRSRLDLATFAKLFGEIRCLGGDRLFGGDRLDGGERLSAGYGVRIARDPA